MVPTTTLTLVDGVHVVVPDSLDLITPYVLREQGDWFEDEIKFLRHALQPGQRAIDIGANHGLYTLAMAKAVGGDGRVWAFEPASTTACLLRASLAANHFGQVVLEQSALSNVAGTARLALNANSEMNKVVGDGQFSGDSETVPLVTLDTSAAKHGWRDIDFVKIDAEGEEVNIVRGGVDFLASESPLIQYEIKDGDGWHLDLVKKFMAIGYKSYRLVPALDVLVPFDENGPIDSYLLNLFCCKPDRAARLAAQGFLVEEQAIGDALASASAPVSNRPGADDKHGWRQTVATLPYGQLLLPHWEHVVAGGQSNDVLGSLAQYARSHDGSLPSVERFAALKASFLNLKRLCDTQPAFMRLSSLARAARDYGARAVAVGALKKLCDTLFQQRQISPAEPFLAPGKRFDLVSPGNHDAMGTWIAAAALEGLEMNQYYSSYYSGKTTVRHLEFIANSGFGGEDIKRRLSLVRRRFDIHANA